MLPSKRLLSCFRSRASHCSQVVGFKSATRRSPSTGFLCDALLGSLIPDGQRSTGHQDRVRQRIDTAVGLLTTVATLAMMCACFPADGQTMEDSPTKGVPATQAS